MTRPADIVVIIVGLALSFWLFGYQQGYDTARAECKPMPSNQIKPMTHKQQMRAVQWAMRDKGAIR